MDKLNHFNPLQSFMEGKGAKRKLDIMQLQEQLASSGGNSFNPVAQKLAAYSSDPITSMANLDANRFKALQQDAYQVRSYLLDKKPELAMGILQNRIEHIGEGDSQHTMDAIKTLQADMQTGNYDNTIKGAEAYLQMDQKSLRSNNKQKSTDGLVFDPQTGSYSIDPTYVENKGKLNEMAVRQAKKIKEQEAKIEVETHNQKTLATQAVTRSGKAHDKLGHIRLNIANLDEGIRLIDEGAKTGAITSLFPSFRSASIQLDNLQGRLGLDVLNTTTFGALSEKELAFALDTALPIKLQGTELQTWMSAKRDAQMKLHSYLQDYAIYMGTPGSTIAKWEEQQKAKQQSASDPLGLGI